MAGHSKWSNIKHRKGAQDAKRGKIFTKLIREITVAARAGGDDVKFNPRLRLAIEKAYASNMPKDTIERAVKKGAGNLDGETLEEVRYEGYGPNGVAVIVDCLTDNKKRTVAEVRHAFTKHNGNLGTDGSVAYLFNKKGIISLDKNIDQDKVMELVLEAGALDLQEEDESIDVITSEESYSAIKDILDENNIEIINSEISLIPDNYINVAGEDKEKILKLLEFIDDLDDVQSVATNANFVD